MEQGAHANLQSHIFLLKTWDCKTIPDSSDVGFQKNWYQVIKSDI